MASRSRGFTIIELMIATMVFAVAITLITAGVLHVARQYQRGVSVTRLQSASRNVHQQVAQSVKYSSATVQTAADSGWQTFCSGNKQYTFRSAGNPVTTASYSDAPTPAGWYGLYMQDRAAAGTCNVPPNPSATGINILTNRSVVLVFQLTDTTLVTRFADADVDLLNLAAPSLPQNVSCKAAVAGREYCSVVQLTSSFAKRIY